MELTWGTYPDARDYGIEGGGLGGLGGLADEKQLLYVADLAPVGSGAAYYPRNTFEDAEALTYLGLMSDAELDAHVGTFGSAAKDQSAGQGAWNPVFRRAVKDAQVLASGAAGPVDGWIGPKTRTALLAIVTKKNAANAARGGGLPVPVSPVPPSLPVPPPGVLDEPRALPSPSTPGGNAIQPAAATEDDDTLLYVGAAVGALALLGIGWWALS